MKIIQGDSLIKLKELPENSVDSIVCDPPYGLSFMGKKWDYDVPSVELWKEAMRVLKPGGHLLSFAGSRTYHRMAVNIEDAGFEIRDQIMWVYGSGFPKSHNIGKAVDKTLGAKREVVGTVKITGHGKDNVKHGTQNRNKLEFDKLSDEAVTEEAKKYEGWGTALKPAHEPIVVARKPLSEKTIAKNVLEWGTGGINIDGCRVGTEERENPQYEGGDLMAISKGGKQEWKGKKEIVQGRFPANFIHDGSDEATEGLGDKARYFYTAKASKKDRNEGLEDMEDKVKLTQMRSANGTGDKNFDGGFQDSIQKNNHPTVKPTKLMQYLVRLVTPKQVPYCPNCDNVLDLGYETKPKEVQTMRQNNTGQGQEGQTEEFLQQEMLSSMDGETKKKTIHNDEQGLQNDSDARTPKDESIRVHNGTQTSDGETSREILGGERSSTSHKRNEDGQPSGELTSDDETGTRQTAEAKSKTNTMPSLSEDDKSIGACQKCGEARRWRKGIVLDCFMGSGSTGKACKLEDFDFIGIELDEEYIKIAEARILSTPKLDNI